jgi:hypothetical protein
LKGHLIIVIASFPSFPLQDKKINRLATVAWHSVVLLMAGMGQGRDLSIFLGNGKALRWF